MKKLLIVLLIIAAGVTGYYLYTQKTSSASNSYDHAQLTGNWETISVSPLKDSTQLGIHYQFGKDVLLLKAGADSIAKDSLQYSWIKNGELQLKKKQPDSSVLHLVIQQLTADSLRWIQDDSTVIQFIKMK